MVEPLVSVLMTAYNRELYITEAIDSVLASDYNNFELIIVDDCSTDKTVDIIKGYLNKDARIRFYQNENNLKDYPNRNRAASYAIGEYLMNVDSDDTIYKDSISYCIHEMSKYENSHFGILARHKDIFNKMLNSHDAIEYHFLNKPFLTKGPGGTIIKRAFFERINRFPENYGPANDMYFNLKAASYGNTVILNRELVFYRKHIGQERNNKFAYLHNGYNYLKDAVAELPFNLSAEQKKYILKKNKRRFAVNIAKFYFKTFDLKKTYAAVKLAKFSISDAFEGIFHL